MLHDFTYEFSRVIKFIGTEQDGGDQALGRGEECGVGVEQEQIQFCKRKILLWRDGGDSSVTM